MASELDLDRAPPRPGRLLWPLWPIAIGMVVTVWAVGPPALPLLGGVAAGYGLTYWSGVDLSLEERLAFGAVLGSAAVALCQLPLALLWGVDLGSSLLGVLIPGGFGIAALACHRPRARADWAQAREGWRMARCWPLWLLLGVAWTWTLVLFSRAYTFTAAGLSVGGLGFYGDWAAHLSYAGSFAYGANFPPQFPIDPGHILAYPFLVDLWAAQLVPWGASLTTSLTLTSVLLALAFPAVMYLSARRLIHARRASALAVMVFVLGGGLGFVHLYPEIAAHGPGILGHLPRLYTQNGAENLQLLNPVLAYLVPQRSVLFGYSLVLIVIGLTFDAARKLSVRSLAFLGSVTGLMPVAHVHAWGTAVALPAFSARQLRWRGVIAYFLLALGLGLPVVWWLLSGGVARVHWQIWWLADSAGHNDGPLWFWLKNSGAFIPAMLLAFLWNGTLPGSVRWRLAPIWLWFLIPNLIVFQPWDWDNTKFFAYWSLLGAIPVGALLSRLFGAGRHAAVIASALLVVLCLAGTLDLTRSLDASQNTFFFTDRGGVRVAAWARTHTPARSIFLTAPENNEPIAALGGRRVVEGYPGWLWTYGLSDWYSRQADVASMLEGRSDAARLMRRYQVAYVLIGPQELGLEHANARFWTSGYPVVYAAQGYTVYKVGSG